MMITPISLIFCGHLGDPIKLDGAALGISVSQNQNQNQKFMYSIPTKKCIQSKRNDFGSGYPY